jgi:hypothetical protein
MIRKTFFFLGILLLWACSEDPQPPTDPCPECEVCKPEIIRDTIVVFEFDTLVIPQYIEKEVPVLPELVLRFDTLVIDGENWVGYAIDTTDPGSLIPYLKKIAEKKYRGERKK